MKTVNLRDATGSLAEYAKSVNGEPLVVLARGKPLAAIVPLEGADLESAAVSLSPVFQKIIRQSRLRQQREGGLTAEELRRHFGIKSKPPKTASKRSKA